MIENIQQIIDEYKPQVDIFAEDDEEVTAMKQAIQTLSKADKIIFVLYAETQSVRQVAKYIGVSHTTIYYIIKDIQKQIKDWMVQHYPNNKKIAKMYDN